MNTLCRRPPRRTAGFTLIELIFVLVLLGILAGLAVPSFSGQVGRTRLDAVLNQIAGDIAYARMLGVRAGQPVGFTTTTGGYTVTRGTGGNTVTVKQVHLADDYPGVNLTSVSLTFNSRGLLVNALSVSPTITASSRGMSSSLVVSPIGRVYRGQ